MQPLSQPFSPLAPLRHVLLIQNISTDPHNRCRELIRAYLESHSIQISVWTIPSKTGLITPSEGSPQHYPDARQKGPAQLGIVLGGDGTFLTAVRFLVGQHIPLVGVNTGTLGFLTRIEASSIHPEGVEGFLNKLVTGNFTLEDRMMLSVVRSSHPDDLPLALNDVVVKNADPSQMACLNVSINGSLVAVYDADGVIISTPTGSTAYNLSAGGPVLSPELEAVCITPICPHSLSAKPVVIPSDKVLTIEVAPKTFERSAHVVVAIDGQRTWQQEDLFLEEHQTLTIAKAKDQVQLVNFGEPEDDFYLLLKKKLHWAMNPRWKSGI